MQDKEPFHAIIFVKEYKKVKEVDWKNHLFEIIYIKIISNWIIINNRNNNNNKLLLVCIINSIIIITINNLSLIVLSLINNNLFLQIILLQ